MRTNIADRTTPVVTTGGDAYQQTVRSLTLLTAEEEKTLAERYQAGLAAAQRLAAGGLTPEERETATQDVAAGEWAKGQLVLRNQRLIFDIAHRYANPQASLDDLVQDGNEGLLRALRSYDPARGRLSTYATHWIRRHILDAASRTASAVHLTDHGEGLRTRAERAAQQLAQQWSRTPSVPEIAVAAGLNEETLRYALAPTQAVSLGKLTVDESPLLDRLADPNAPDPARQAERLAELDDLRRAIAQALKGLPSLDRHVLAARFGLDGGVSRDSAAIAAELGISSGRAHRIVTAVLSQLRAATALQCYRATRTASRSPQRCPRPRLQLADPATSLAPAGPTWADLIEHVLRTTGGYARLNQIYAALADHPKAQHRQWQAGGVRCRLQRALLAADDRRKRFVPLGRGVWTLRQLSWQDLVAAALVANGGHATVQEIYGLLVRHPMVENVPHWRSVVRNALQRGRDREGRFAAPAAGIWSLVPSRVA